MSPNNNKNKLNMGKHIRQNKVCGHNFNKNINYTNTNLNNNLSSEITSYCKL